MLKALFFINIVSIVLASLIPQGQLNQIGSQESSINLQANSPTNIASLDASQAQLMQKYSNLLSRPVNNQFNPSGNAIPLPGKLSNISIEAIKQYQNEFLNSNFSSQNTNNIDHGKNNTIDGKENTISSGDENTIKGYLNMINGSKNLINGNSNNVKGGDNKIINSSNNIVYGNGNVIQSLPQIDISKSTQQNKASNSSASNSASSENNSLSPSSSDSSVESQNHLSTQFSFHLPMCYLLLVLLLLQ